MGASVRQGQVIGYVGCTGRCFGDHLHFEVRINGSVTNPHELPVSREPGAPLASHPRRMQPEIDVLGLPLKTFGLMFALGFLAAGAIISRRLRELGKPADWASEIVFAALAGGLIGARLYWVVQHWSQVSDDPIGGLFGGTGLTWYGGAIGGAVFVLAWAWWRGFLGLVLLDVCAVPLALGYAIGRIGCQLSGDGDYGKAWSGPGRWPTRDGTVPTTRDGAPHAGLRDARDGARRPGAVAAARPLQARGPLRALPRGGGPRALPRRVPAPQRPRRGRA